MKILITGSSGFIAKNLIVSLEQQGYNDIYKYNRQTDQSLLEKWTKDCDIVYNFAGVMRPKYQDDFKKDNVDFLNTLITCLKKNKNNCPIVLTSSTQSGMENNYGITKKESEEILFNYGLNNNSRIFMYRLPNVYGRWNKPNYNSAIATFCYNISRNLEIKVNDPNVELTTLYINDLVNDLISCLKKDFNKINNKKEIEKISTTHKVSLGYIVDLLYRFSKLRENNELVDFSDDFIKKLYSTYISFIPEEELLYSNVNFEQEFQNGNISIKIIKNNQYNDFIYQNETTKKIKLVKGDVKVLLQKFFSDTKLEYTLDSFEKILEIPVGYKYKIYNISKNDSTILEWSNEVF